MAAQALPRIEVRDDEGAVAWADAIVQSDSDGHVELIASVSAANGHHRPRAHVQLITELLDQAAEIRAERMTVSLPAGDFDAIDVLHNRAPAAVTRLAGSTCIAEVELDPLSRPRS